MNKKKNDLLSEMYDGVSPFDTACKSVGLGVDIVEIARMRTILRRTPCFRERVFSEEERAYCDATALPEAHYATRFAAKEALVKALGVGFSQGIGVRDIEVRRTVRGRPYLVLSGKAKQYAQKQDIGELPLSLSYTHTDAVACVLALTKDTLKPTFSPPDPAQELAQRFKQARSLLDN